MKKCSHLNNAALILKKYPSLIVLYSWQILHSTEKNQWVGQNRCMTQNPPYLPPLHLRSISPQYDNGFKEQNRIYIAFFVITSLPWTSESTFVSFVSVLWLTFTLVPANKQRLSGPDSAKMCIRLHFWQRSGFESSSNFVRATDPK